MLVNLLNPKIGAFYLALLPQFLPPGHSPALMGVLLAGVHNLEAMVWFTGIILAVDRMRPWLTAPAVQRWIDAVAGVTVTALGLALGLSRS